MEHLTKDQINQLLDGEQADLKVHLESCIQCNEKYKAALDIHCRLAQLDYQRPSMRFAKNIIELIVRREELDKVGRFWIKVIVGGLLSSVGLTVAFTSHWIFISDLEQGVESIMIKWVGIAIMTILCAWGLYFFDKWLGNKLMKSV